MKRRGHAFLILAIALFFLSFISGLIQTRAKAEDTQAATKISATNRRLPLNSSADNHLLPDRLFANTPRTSFDK